MTSRRLEVEVPADLGKSRLDAALAALVPERSRSALQKLISSGGVSLNGKVETSCRAAVKGGDRLQVGLPEIASFAVAGSASPFTYPILYEDEHMLVIDKPSGVVVHPGAGNWSGTVVNAMQERYPEWVSQWESEDLRPGIVHRLDKETSGCLVIAKNPVAQAELSRAFAERRAEKTYYALAHGIFKNRRGELGGLIGRHPVNRKKMALVDRNGKEALSRYEVERQGLIDGIAVSLVKIDIFTGRTHQIRVHLSSIKHPILGDELYGGAKGIPCGMMLYASRLAIPHPSGGENIECFSCRPAEFSALLERMEELPSR